MLAPSVYVGARYIYTSNWTELVEGWVGVTVTTVIMIILLYTVFPRNLGRGQLDFEGGVYINLDLISTDDPSICRTLQRSTNIS